MQRFLKIENTHTHTHLRIHTQRFLDQDFSVPAMHLLHGRAYRRREPFGNHVQVVAIPVGLLQRLLNLRDPCLHGGTIHRRLPTHEIQAIVHGCQGQTGHGGSVRSRGRGHSPVPRDVDGSLRGLRHMHCSAGPRSRVHGHLRAGSGVLEGTSGVRNSRSQCVRDSQGQLDNKICNIRVHCSFYM